MQIKNETVNILEYKGGNNANFVRLEKPDCDTKCTYKYNTNRAFNETNLDLYTFSESEKSSLNPKRQLAELESLRFPIRWFFKWKEVQA